VAVLALTVVLSDIDVRVTRDALFLAHLGIGRRHIGALTALIAGVAEITFRIALVAVFA
jgi:hypothetical protein